MMKDQKVLALVVTRGKSGLIVSSPHGIRVLGDMSEFSHAELEEWNEVYCKHGFQVGGAAGMETGDISIFCNFRFAHGRPGYELDEGQKREIGVVIGKQFIRNGSKEGSW